MKINFKKTLIYALTTSILLGNITPAMAGRDSIGKVTKTQETDKSESLNTTVYAELGSFFKVSIPKHIILDGTTKSGTYTVSAIGDIAGYETLKVTPDKSFTLKSNNLNDVTATINQDKTSWKFNEVLENSNVLGNGAIDAKDITAGSWNGNFNFNIFLDGATTSIKVEAKDSEGNDLNASASDINGSEKEALLNKLVESGMIESIDEVDALIEVKSNQFEGIADTTFDVSSIAKEGEKIAILHFNEETNEWEYISTETVDSNGLIKSDFTSYSPVAFVKVTEDGNFENVSLEAGLYDANGIMLCIWEESGIDNTCSNAKDIIKNTYPETTKVIISDTVTSIGKSAFYGCKNLDTVIFSDSVTNINWNAFEYCTNLKNVELGNGLTNIGYRAFYDCTNLSKIEIPDSVTSIDGYGAFGNCTSLTNIKISKNITKIDTGVFVYCSNLKSIIVDEANTNYCSVNGILFTKDMSELITYPAGKTDISYIIPDSVTTIKERAFESCSNLTNITIPNSVTSIESCAFIACNGITSVGGVGSGANIELPSSITKIETRVFQNCKNLVSLEIPYYIYKIGKYAFCNCNSLTDATFEDTTTWYVGDSEGSTTTTLKSSGLSNTSSAATALISTHYDKYWTKK